MDVYYLMVEAVPCRDNPESGAFGGAYVNCWVKAASQTEARNIAREYIRREKWQPQRVEELRVVQREWYFDEPDSLACYDEACKNGLGAMFYTWPTAGTTTE